MEDIEEEVHNAIDKEREERMLLLCINRQIINTEFYQSYLLICVKIVSNSSFKEDHHIAELITSEMNRLMWMNL